MPETRDPGRRIDRLLSLAVMAVMLLHVYVKYRRGILPELLWGCNLASFCVMSGLWFARPVPVGMGFLWFACVGDPWNLYLMVTERSVNPVSAAIHGVSTIAAFISLRRTGLPSGLTLRTFIFFAAMMPVTRYLTPPSLNVNFAHQPVPLLQRHFPGTFEYPVVFAAMMLFPMLLGEFVLARFFVRHPAPHRPSAPSGRARGVPEERNWSAAVHQR